MFAPVFDSLSNVTAPALRMQQDLYEKWVSLWPGMRPTEGAATAPALQVQKKWADFYEETVKRQRETLQRHFQAGLDNIQEAFHLAEAKDPEELRAKTIQLWQKVFETLRQSYETQLHDFQAIASRWTELVTRGAV